MREIKEYLITKKNDNVIMLNIGGEIKHYPILSFDYNIEYHRSINHLYISNSQLVFKTNSSNLINLLSDHTFTNKYSIYIGNKIFHGCFVTKYEVDLNNITIFTISVDYLEIN